MLHDLQALLLTLPHKFYSLSLALLPVGGLPVDLLKLRWSPALTLLGPRLTEALPSHPDGVVLTAVDRAAAIGWGWELGITLFQGSLVGVRGR